MPAHSKFDETLFESICERVANGETVAQVCRDLDVCRRTFDRWCDADPELARRRAEAREAGEDAIADECLSIADEREGRALMPGGEEVAVVFDSTAVQRNKLRVWTRLELLKKWNPKKWGERQSIEHSGTIQTMSDEEVEAKYAALRAKLGDSGDASGDDHDG